MKALFVRQDRQQVGAAWSLMLLLLLAGSIHYGDTAQVTVDGIKDPFLGKVSYISPRAEYTPPVIYSRESRAKLVFLVESVFDPQASANLHPGQPFRSSACAASFQNSSFGRSHSSPSSFWPWHKALPPDLGLKMITTERNRL